jgi:hypothetical protein
LYDGFGSCRCRRCLGCRGCRLGSRLLRGGLLGRRCASAIGGRAVTTRRRRGEDFTQLADDGGFDGRRRGADELSQVAELGHDDLALDPKLLCELVDPDLIAGCSSSTHSFRPASGALVGCPALKAGRAVEAGRAGCAGAATCCSR